MAAVLDFVGMISREQLPPCKLIIIQNSMYHVDIVRDIADCMQLVYTSLPDADFA